MIDLGATALFISQRFVNKHCIPLIPLNNTIALHNIDRTKNKASGITHVVQLTLVIFNYEEELEFCHMPFYILCYSDQPPPI